MTGFRPGAWRAPLGCGRPGAPAGVPCYALRAGPCRPSGSVTRREKAGQTRSIGSLCSRTTAIGGAAGQPLYCRSCDPTTHVRVSLRDRRDARPHAHHLLRHPDVHRPTVQGPAAVDGAHAGTRSVRPGGQVDAALRHVQAWRHRRLHAAPRLDPGGRHAVHQARHRARRRDGRHPRRPCLHQRSPSSTSRTSMPIGAGRSAATDDRPRR